MRRPVWRTLLPVLAIGTLLSGCEYVRLLRPSVLKQLNPDVVRLVNTLPAVDDPNEAMVARLFAHGGLSYAEEGRDGVFRDEITVPKNQFIWRPAIIRMPRGGELELDFHNTDQNLHAAFVPSNPERQEPPRSVRSQQSGTPGDDASDAHRRESPDPSRPARSLLVRLPDLQSRRTRNAGADHRGWRSPGRGQARSSAATATLNRSE